jgi:hypothetical protein
MWFSVLVMRFFCSFFRSLVGSLVASGLTVLAGELVFSNKTALQLSKERCPIRLKQRINHLRKEWKVRKYKCTAFVEQLADGLEKKPKDVLGLLDIDTANDNLIEK